LDSVTRKFAGLEQVAQTDVRQNGAHYNRSPAKWKHLKGKLPFFKRSPIMARTEL
jgi:hypothetical protein